MLVDLFEAIPSAVLISILTLGIVLLAAGAIGGGLKALNVEVPGLETVRKQVGAGAIGILLASVAGYGLSLQYWSQRFDRMELGAAGQPPPPWDKKHIENELNVLANNAGNDRRRNCLIAAFVETTAVDIPFVVRVRMNDAVHNANPGLSCYRDIAMRAIAQVNGAEALSGAATGATAAGAPSPTPAVAIVGSSGGGNLGGSAHLTLDSRVLVASARNVAGPGSAADHILEALSAPGQQGWVYLGKVSNGALGDDRTVTETIVAQGADVRLRTAVHLRDPSATANHRQSAIVGVVPNGAIVHVNVLDASASFRWAKITVVSVPHAAP